MTALSRNSYEADTDTQQVTANDWIFLADLHKRQSHNTAKWSASAYASSPDQKEVMSQQQDIV